MTVVKDLFSSKKFLVMLAAIIMAIASKLGLALDPELINQILALAGAFIVGQGIADHGKEAAKVAAAAGPMMTTVTEKAPNGTTTETTTVVGSVNPQITAPKNPLPTTLLVLLCIGMSMTAAIGGCASISPRATAPALTLEAP